MENDLIEAMKHKVKLNHHTAQFVSIFLSCDGRQLCPLPVAPQNSQPLHVHNRAYMW